MLDLSRVDRMIREELSKIPRIVCFSLYLLLGVTCMSCTSIPERVGEQSAERETFTNPVVKKPSADPWVVRAGNMYYYVYSTGRVNIAKAEKLQDIGHGVSQTIWSPPITGAYSSDIWAPELHYVFGRWYVYVAADDGNNENHRMYVLEGGADPDDPLSEKYTFKGKITSADDKWAIDGTVMEHNGQHYFIWSGWEEYVDGRQDIYIAPMSDACTISGDRVMIATPEYSWEKQTMSLLEGPQILQHDGNTFIIYSASASWTPYYCLGILTLEGSDPLDPGAWVKGGEPVLKASTKSFGVGHCSFVKSPDGQEDWIVYHGMTGSAGWENRDVRMQPFVFRDDGTPDFGEPVAVGEEISAPSGQ